MMGNRVAAYNFSILLIAREGIEPPTSHRTNWLQQRGVCRSRILFVWQRSVNEQVKALESPEVFASVARSAPMPIYGLTVEFIGDGIIGGYVFTTGAFVTKTLPSQSGEP
jgi:hypothetical protein